MQIHARIHSIALNPDGFIISLVFNVFDVVYRPNAYNKIHRNPMFYVVRNVEQKEAPDMPKKAKAFSAIAVTNIPSLPFFLRKTCTKPHSGHRSWESALSGLKRVREV